MNHGLDELEVLLPRRFVEDDWTLLHQRLELGEHLRGHFVARIQLANLAARSCNARIAAACKLLCEVVKQSARGNRAAEARRIETIRRSVKSAIGLDAASAVHLTPRVRLFDIGLLVRPVRVLLA